MPASSWDRFCPLCGLYGPHKARKVNLLMKAKDVVFNCEMCGCGFKVQIIRDPVAMRYDEKRPVQAPKGKRKKNKGAGDAKWIKVMRASPCHYCGAKGGTIDHKHPVIAGGKTTKENCVPCCGPCNLAKGSLYTYSEFKGGAWRRRLSGSKMALGGRLVGTGVPKGVGEI